jgi:hypothetical protein
MKPVLYFAFGVLFFLLTGCDDSKNPLSDPQASKADEWLVGVWWDGDVYYHIGHAGEQFPAGMMRIVEVKHTQGKLAPPQEYLAFPTVLGDKAYLNVVIGEKEVNRLDEKGWTMEAVDSYTFIKYQVDGNKLVAWAIDEKAKEQAITGGKIKGVTEKDKPAKFTDTTENLAHFVAEAGDSLWETKKPGRFERITTYPRKTEESQIVPTPPLRPLGSNLMVDKNNIIWDQGRPVGIWGIDGR